MEEVGVCPEKLNDSISDDHLCEIALFLTSWCKVAPYIGLREMDINDVQREGKNEQDQTLNALERWKGKFGFKATYQKLVEVLLSLAMADVAEKVCRLLQGMHQLCMHVSLPSPPPLHQTLRELGGVWA